MKTENLELDLLDQPSDEQIATIQELSELQLAIVGGGGGEVVFH